MINVTMGRKLLTDMYVGSMSIGHQMGILIYVLINDGLQCRNFFIINRYGPYRAVALGCYQDSLFGCALAALINNAWFWLRLSTDIGLIQFNDAI